MYHFLEIKKVFSGFPDFSVSMFLQVSFGNFTETEKPRNQEKIFLISRK